MVATGYTSGDPQKVGISGDTMTGPLVLTDGSAAASQTHVAAQVAAEAVSRTSGDAASVATAAAGAAGLYLPLTGGTVTGGLTIGAGDVARAITLRSSYAGGDDDGVTGHFDSTSRIELESYQRANVGSYGEVIRIRSKRARSKQMIAWYGPTSFTTYDPIADTGGDPIGPDKGWAWIGPHYLATEGTSPHGHWSIETPDAAALLRTRFEISIWDPVSGVYGMDKTLIKTNQADFVVRCSNLAVLRLTGGAGDRKPIEWSNSENGVTSGLRWQLRTDGTAEAGSNAGSDLEFARYSDSGVQQDSPLAISRGSGRITIGGSTGSAAGLTINRNASSAVAITIAHTGTGGIGASVTSADVTSRIIQGQVSGDAAPRLVAFADGKVEWGPGNAGRDTNLYRSAANVLKTDDALHVALDFRHLGSSLGFYNSAAIAKPTVSGSRAAPEQALASLLTALANLGLVTNSTTA